MYYIQGDTGLLFILSIDKSENIKWYIDAAFVVHKGMRSHTGGFVYMGTGGAYVRSKKKLNTKSSTEAEFVTVVYVLTQLIWTQYFQKEQGCEIHDNVIYQDNQRAIKLENNGRLSRIKRTRHINIRYYFITDKITKQEASVKFCPTLDIIGEYFMKALQGSQFHRFCSIIIGIHKYYIPYYNSYQR